MTGRGIGDDGEPRGVTTAEAIPSPQAPIGPTTARDATNGVTGCGGRVGCAAPRGVMIWEAIPAAHKPMRPICARCGTRRVMTGRLSGADGAAARMLLNAAMPP
jgi:hypothetical protein